MTSNKTNKAASVHLVKRVVSVAGPASLDHEEGEDPDRQDPGQGGGKKFLVWVKARLKPGQKNLAGVNQAQYPFRSLST